jgi:hypothetical protein
LLLAGCSVGPGSAPVSGTIKLDGKPLADGEISFITVGYPPETLPVKDGSYQGKVKVGEHKVEVAAWRDAPQMMGGKEIGRTKENYIAPRFNQQSQLKADVKASGSNTFSFEVYSQ